MMYRNAEERTVQNADEEAAVAEGFNRMPPAPNPAYPKSFMETPGRGSDLGRVTLHDENESASSSALSSPRIGTSTLGTSTAVEASA